MLIISYMGDHVWLITSKQTEPDLECANLTSAMLFKYILSAVFVVIVMFLITPQYCSISVHLQLVYVGVEDAVREADAGRLVGVLVGQLDVDFPDTTFEGSLAWALKLDVELLPAHDV